MPPSRALLTLDADKEPSDPTILRLIEELECGMCAGLFIDVSRPPPSTLQPSRFTLPTLTHPTACYLPRAQLTPACRAQRLRPHLLWQLCCSVDCCTFPILVPTHAVSSPLPSTPPWRPCARTHRVPAVPPRTHPGGHAEPHGQSHGRRASSGLPGCCSPSQRDRAGGGTVQPLKPFQRCAESKLSVLQD